MTFNADSPEIAWCAGLFEGEGCICRANSRRPGDHCVSMTITLTDYDVLARYAQILEGRVTGPHHTPSMKREGNRKPYWRWSEAKVASVPVILEAFWPYLGERRRGRATELGFVPGAGFTWERPCVRCGTLFAPRPNGRYCSRACFLEARKVKDKRYYQEQRRDDPAFKAARGQRNKAWRDEHPTYDADWKRRRRSPQPGSGAVPLW